MFSFVTTSNANIAINYFQRKDLTIDHVKPLSKGGKHIWENVTTACTKCNNKKGSTFIKRVWQSPSKHSQKTILAPQRRACTQIKTPPSKLDPLFSLMKHSCKVLGFLHLFRDFTFPSLQSNCF